MMTTGYSPTGAGKSKLAMPRWVQLIRESRRAPRTSSLAEWPVLFRFVRWCSDGRNRPRSNYAPRTLGSAASLLLKLLDRSRYDAKLTPREQSIVRLWVESDRIAFAKWFASAFCLARQSPTSSLVFTQRIGPTGKRSGIDQPVGEPARLVIVRLLFRMFADRRTGEPPYFCCEVLRRSISFFRFWNALSFGTTWLAAPAINAASANRRCWISRFT